MEAETRQRRQRRSFSAEFKAGAVSLVLDKGKKVAQDAPMKRVFYQSEKDFTWGASWYLRAYSDYQAAMASRSQPHV
jgi:hypothetical protein